MTDRSRFHAPICQIPKITRGSDIPMIERGRVLGVGGWGEGLKSAAGKFSKISCLIITWLSLQFCYYVDFFMIFSFFHFWNVVSGLVITWPLNKL